ncbi:dihydroneopterin aldolase [Vulgatibacter sp.]|uniref:dihydroneopterin aldolase n=1 Tax=Vulgatibacter sp. TaxID=1971226 RepID=UPI003567A332
MQRPFLTTNGRSLDAIEVRGLRADCIVGVYPEERRTVQTLQVDLALFLDTRAAAAGAGLEASLDYARLAGEIRFLLESCRFRLLETAAEALCSYILAPPTADAPHAQVEAVSVRLTKPGALGGDAVPSLEIHRSREEMGFPVEEKKWGRVDVLHASQGCGIYRLRIAPGASIPTHVHQAMEERELILGSNLLLQGRPVAPGSAFRWPKDLPHRYDNPAQVEGTILCVDRPAFLPHDEIEVAHEGELPWVEPVPFYPAAERAR